MSAPRPSLETRAAGVPIRKPPKGHDQRSGAEYAAALARETDRSLRDASVWPYTGPQRWRPKTTAALGGGFAVGERHGLAKLTEAQVREIRSFYATGPYSIRSLAERYGVAEGTIRPLVQGKTWKHLPMGGR